MKSQVILAKRLFLIGSEYADKSDPVSVGMAISMFQDSVEIFLWALAKELDASVKEKAFFTTLFDVINQAPKNIEKKKLPFKAKLLELNTARVNFKHYGNLPDVSEARKFKAYTEDFLTISCEDFLSEDFNNISLTDLIKNIRVREHLKLSENYFNEKNFTKSITETAIAKEEIFRDVGKYLPSIKNMSQIDSVFVKTIPELRHLDIFAKLSNYLEESKKINIAAILGIPIHDYYSVISKFPSVHIFSSGRPRVRLNMINKETTKEEAQRAFNLVQTMSFNSEKFIGNTELI